MITATLIFPAIIFFVFFIFKKWSNHSKNSNPNRTKTLPPGPKPLPIIGNLHLMTAPPFRGLRDLSRRYGPLMHLQLGEVTAVIVSSPDLARQILRDMDPSFAHRPRMPAFEVMWSTASCFNIAFSPYGSYWRQMRKICSLELLSNKMVRSFRPLRGDEAGRLVDSVAEASGRPAPLNITEKIFFYSSSVLSRAAFGGVCSELETLVGLMLESLKTAGGFDIGDFFPSSRIVRALSWRKFGLKTIRRKLEVILDGVIDRHVEARAAEGGGGGGGGKDLVDVFLRVKEGEQLEFPIHNNNIKAVLYDIFSAGTDTSAATIDWTMVELMRNPRVMATAQAEVRQALQGIPSSEQNDVIHNLKYLKLVIKETLRLHPPIPMIPRCSHEEHVINGYTIPARSKLIVNIWAMQRDPKFWKDPERFEPERFENPHQAWDSVGGDFHYLPFGYGKRLCPGITFGMASVELALAQLLYNFDWKLPEGVRAEDLDMTESIGLTASRKESLFVVATPYVIRC